MPKPMPSEPTLPRQSQQDVACAKAVLDQEIKGLQALQSVIESPHFLQAADIISQMQGRVIVSGMGKSGHIARKIAATMASTGTPAHFVHPGEASHGDLGMITPNDVLLLLSNSGETAELSDIIAYAKRFSIPLIGMVRRAGSTLVEAADAGLVLPDVPETSPTGAPTTSTTMMLALGDALAMVLLERKGFTKEDFHVFHPGGKLGSMLQRVSGLMHKGEDVPLVSLNATMESVLLVMTGKRFGCAGVIDADGKLAGIITDGDLRRNLSPDLLHLRAAEVMTVNPRVTTPQTVAQEAVALMNRHQITTLFVVEAEKPVGILHMHDCLRAGVA